MLITLEREKETKNKVRFLEEGGGELLGMVYVPKSTLNAIGRPDRIAIELTAAAAERPLAAVE